MNRKGSSQSGYAMLAVVVFVAVLLTSAVATLQLTRSETHSTADQAAKQRSFYIAERGVQHALAKLDQDRTASPSSVSTSYSSSLSNQSFNSGTYNVSVAQDSTFPTDATRKLITSTGRFANQSSIVTAHAIVQNPPSSTVCFTSTGTCTIDATVSAANSLFNGEIFSNNNVAFNTTVGVLMKAAGNVYAKNTFSASGLTVAGITATSPLLSYLSGASLFAGNAYAPSGLLLGALTDIHVPLLGAPMGIHFNNGANALVGANGGVNQPNGHGVVQTITARNFPHPNWEAIRRDPNTIIVRPGSVPFGSWDSTNNTWVAGNVNTSASDNKIYYVEGDAYLTSLNLATGTNTTIVARGDLALKAVSVLSTGLIANSNQNVRLLSQKSVYVGRNILSLPIASGLETELTSLSPSLAGATGLGLSIAGIANTTNILAYSETNDVWLKASTISAASANNINMMALHDATLSYTAAAAASIASTSGAYN